MCCFARPVDLVSNTQIFARLSGTGTQFLAYQMNYKSPDENAMILPIPVQQPAGEEALKFISLENYETFFADLADGFPYESRGGVGCSMDPTAAVDSMALEVFKVGNYIASFVPTIADFDRLDEKFTLPREVWQSVPGYENFGFAVFQLAAGSLKPHPMAFEFKTGSKDVFFPTIHIHDGEVHEAEHFDHALYLQHAGLDSKVGGYRNADIESKSTGLIRSKHPASRFADVEKATGLIDGDLLVHRKFFNGMLPNTDTTFAITGDPLRRSFNLRAWLPYAPWLLASAALVWFFNRRSKLKQ